LLVGVGFGVGVCWFLACPRPRALVLFTP